jgi:Helix-turn-helix domain
MSEAKKTTAHTANQTYTAQQAQAVLGIKHDKFYNLVNSGQLETFKNGRRYVTAEAIDRYQQEQMKLERERVEARRG